MFTELAIHATLLGTALGNTSAFAKLFIAANVVRKTSYPAVRIARHSCDMHMLDFKLVIIHHKKMDNTKKLETASVKQIYNMEVLRAFMRSPSHARQKN